VVWFHGKEGLELAWRSYLGRLEVGAEVGLVAVRDFWCFAVWAVKSGSQSLPHSKGVLLFNTRVDSISRWPWVLFVEDALRGVCADGFGCAGFRAGTYIRLLLLLLAKKMRKDGEFV